jgi:hypothetical protein
MIQALSYSQKDLLRIISKKIDDFDKYGLDFIAQVVPNFWGTNFEVLDYGYEKRIYDKSPKNVNKLRDKRVKRF